MNKYTLFRFFCMFVVGAFFGFWLTIVLSRPEGVSGLGAVIGLVSAVFVGITIVLVEAQPAKGVSAGAEEDPAAD